MVILSKYFIGTVVDKLKTAEFLTRIFSLFYQKAERLNIEMTICHNRQL